MKSTNENSSLSVKVAVRVRPLSNNDLNKPGMHRIAHKQIVKASPETETVTITHDQQKSFYFDHVFNDTSNQDEVFNRCVQQLVQAFLQGFNATILAYGQTSSGKTYTMGTTQVQNDEEDGIIPRAVAEIFQLTQQEKHLKQKLYLSFLELYNEELVDLLSENLDPLFKPEIQIRQDLKGKILIDNLTELEVNSPEEVFDLLSSGSMRRQTGSTEMNENSSRSHAIFSLKLVQETYSESTEGKGNKSFTKSTLQSKFNFVDLAGSERIKKTGAVGNRAKEGININGGLLALGNVISALGDSQKKAQHVPYRDSKLTRLLQDSVGGNSYTLMIACISPAYSDINETLNTLKYANRARNIKNKIKKNEEEEYDIDTMKEIISLLRNEIKLLKINGKSATSVEESQITVENIAILYQRNVALEKDLSLVKKLYTTLQQKYNTLATLYSKTQRDYESSKSASSEFTEFKQQPSTHNHLALENKKLKENLADLQGYISEMKNTYEKNIIEKIKTIETLRNDISTQQTTFDELYQENNKQKNRIDELETKINERSQLEHNFESLSIGNDPRAFEESFDENDEVEKHIEKINNDIKSLKSSIVVDEKEPDESTLEMETLINKHNKDKLMIEKLQLELSEMRSNNIDKEIQDLFDEDEDLKEDFYFNKADYMQKSTNISLIKIMSLVENYKLNKKTVSDAKSKTVSLNDAIYKFIDTKGYDSNTSGNSIPKNHSTNINNSEKALQLKKELFGELDLLKHYIFSVIEFENIDKKTQYELKEEVSTKEEQINLVYNTIKEINNQFLEINERSSQVENKESIQQELNTLKNNISNEKEKYDTLKKDHDKIDTDFKILKNRLAEVQREMRQEGTGKSNSKKNKFLCF